jgi:hypothetical protein
MVLTKTVAGAAAGLLTTGLAAVGVGALAHHEVAAAADRPDQQRCG